LYAQFADALIAFTSASSGKQIESYYSTFCVMRAAFNLTGDEKNSEFVTAYCCNILLKKMINNFNYGVFKVGVDLFIILSYFLINNVHFPLNQLAKLDFLCNYLPFLAHLTQRVR
jgi:hypothetical protein